MTSARPSSITWSAILRSCDFEPARGVEQQHDDLGVIDRAPGVGGRQPLELVLDLGALAQAGGVDQPHRLGPCHSQSRLIESRVIPASGPVIIRSSPSIRLTSVDLPALGRPTIASLSGAAFVVLLVLGFDLRRASTMRPQRLEQVDDAFAMLGAERDRLAEARAR